MFLLFNVTYFPSLLWGPRETQSLTILAYFVLQFRFHPGIQEHSQIVCNKNCFLLRVKAPHDDVHVLSSAYNIILSVLWVIQNKRSSLYLNSNLCFTSIVNPKSYYKELWNNFYITFQQTKYSGYKVLCIRLSNEKKSLIITHH